MAEVAGREGLAVGQVRRQDAPEEEADQEGKDEEVEPVEAGPGENGDGVGSFTMLHEPVRRPLLFSVDMDRETSHRRSG